MKKIYSIALAASALMLSSCNDFLDTETYTDKNTTNFPATAADAEQMIAGIYNNLNIVNANPQTTFFYWAELASDDRLGGGGTNDQMMQAEDLMVENTTDMYNQFWKDRYAGILRANLAIETLDNCQGLDEATINKYKGEAHFLRAYYYYELASMFGNIPVPLATTPDYTLPQVSGEPLWGQILQDCKAAIDLMPAKKGTEGHADKYCAQGLLGRCYLFYAGYYNDADVTCPDGTSIGKDYVTAQIDDCVKNSGYKLVGTDKNDGTGYYNLWAYTNNKTVNDDLSAYKGKGLNWVGDQGTDTNTEAMFAVKFNTQPSWSTTIGYANGYALHFAIRGGQDYDKTFPFGQGWGAGPVAPNLVSDWEAADPADPRLDASVQIVSALPGYKYGGWNDFIQETDYWQKKIVTVTARKAAPDDDKFWASFANAYYTGLTWSSGNSDNMQLNSIHDMVLMRFAEVLLMQSELHGNNEGMNLVRKRSGLAPLPYSVDNIRNERRFELAFEGLRYNDIRRYGEDYAKAALKKQEGQPIYIAGKKTTNNVSTYNSGYDTRYGETKGWAPIPESQISLSASKGADYKYTQNPGWEGRTNYGGWAQ